MGQQRQEGFAANCLRKGSPSTVRAMTDDADVPADSHQQMRVSAQALRGLAHPLRARLLDELRINGPATATILGRRLGESSGATSYHLRQLSRYGFIDNEPGRTGGRERWWRMRPGGWSMSGHEFLSNPETRVVAQAVLDRLYQQKRRRFADWTALVSDSPDLPAVRRWKDAATDSTSHARMTPGRRPSSPTRSTTSSARGGGVSRDGPPRAIPTPTSSRWTPRSSRSCPRPRAGRRGAPPSGTEPPRRPSLRSRAAS